MSAPSPTPSRTALEDLWRERLRQASDRYTLALAQSGKLLAEANLGLSELPDFAEALRRCRFVEAAAREEYMRILRIFTDLTLNRVMPPE